MKHIIHYLVIAIRLALGILFIYAGIQKFKPAAPKPETTQETTTKAQATEVPENVVKIRAYIGGLKQTGFFWPMLGVAEITCGLLLISQVLALLGAVMLIPLTLNIFLFEVFLGGGNVGEIITHGLYFVGNILLLVHGYPRLKVAFLTTDNQFQKIIQV